jgi:hypothetical protein
VIIFLRQANVDPSAPGSSSLTLQDCCFIRVEYSEVFHDRVEFLPKNGTAHSWIYKTDDHDWIEPMSGIVYEFLFVEKLEDYMPGHLEISYPQEAKPQKIIRQLL